MRRIVFILGGLVAVGAGILVAWRRNPRMGTGYVNEVVNPFLVAHGMAGAGRSEIGTLEHFGRRTGTRHLTPIHPVGTDDGFRIVVPLGEQSQWARNVLAAGHCRMQLHDVVYELDEPALLAAGEVPGMAAPMAWIQDRLGMEYLLLRRFAAAPGALEPLVETATPAGPLPGEVQPEPASATVA
jgi:hypothetical protein